MPIARVVLKGTRHYCAPSAARRGDLLPGARLALIAEVGNLYDANAVEVRLAKTDEKLGYLSRQIAPRYRHRIQSGSIIHAKIAEFEMVQGHDGQQKLRIEIYIEYQESKRDEHPSGYRTPSSNNEQLPSGPGVYAIVNDVSQRSYIGSSKNIKSRVNQHFRDLEVGIHANALLQKEYSIYLSKGFTATVIERLQRPEQCEAAESRAITAALRQKQKLYNMTEDGQGSAAARFETTVNAEAAESISERAAQSQKRKPNGSDGASAVSVTRGSFTDLSHNSIVPTPQRNPDIRWLWIVGGIVLLIWIIQGR